MTLVGKTVAEKPVVMYATEGIQFLHEMVAPTTQFDRFDLASNMTLGRSIVAALLRCPDLVDRKCVPDPESFQSRIEGLRIPVGTMVV
jgi:hypothetical protein